MGRQVRHIVLLPGVREEGRERGGRERERERRKTEKERESGKE